MSITQTSDLWNIVKQEKTYHTAFWGDYENLNTQPIPSDSALFRIQMAKIKTKALEQKNTGIDAANQFIKAIEQTSPEGLHSDLEQYTVQKLSSSILSLLNKAFISNPDGLKMQYFDRDSNKHLHYKNKNISEARAAYKQEQDNLVLQLKTLLQMISFSSEKMSLDTITKAFEAGLKSGGGKFNKSLIQSTGFKNYRDFKAALAEELMVSILNSNPSWQSVVTGKFLHNGQQLLEDAFAFALDAELRIGGNFEVTIQNTGGKKVSTHQISSLSQFFELVNGLKLNQTISLNDELYDELKKISVVKAQAKSGFGLQSLINETVERGAISIESTGSIKALEQLYDLYELDWINSEKSSGVGALANYCLSKAIAKTTLLQNDIYFTRDGFITASDWMQNYQYMLKFNPAADIISSGYLTQVRPYRLEAIQS